MPKKENNKNKRVFFSIADSNNMEYFKLLEKSFKHFHPNEELKLVGPHELNTLLKQDPQFYYRATPVVAWNLMNEGYDTVIKIDADSLITGDISHTWEGSFDVAVVNNSNPREQAKYSVSVWNVHPLSYVNAGYVVMKSRTFVEHWMGLCTSPHFEHYQMREQDLLNIMVFYMNLDLKGPYDVRLLDASEKAHGLVVKGYWLDMVVKDGKLILPKNEEWNQEDKEVVILHWAGGNTPHKMNINTQFKESVAKWLNNLVK